MLKQERTPEQGSWSRRARGMRLKVLTFGRDALVVLLAYFLALLAHFDGRIPAGAVRGFLLLCPLIVASYVASLYLFGIHRRMWRLAGGRDVSALFQAALPCLLLLGAVDVLFPGRLPPISVVVVGWIFALAALIAVRLGRRLIYLPAGPEAQNRVLIVGAGAAGHIVITDLLQHRRGQDEPVSFVDDDPAKQGMRLNGVPVRGTIDDIPGIVEREQIDTIAVAIPSASSEQVRRILMTASSTPARLQILPSLGELVSGRAELRLRDINLDDLLGRQARHTAAEGPDAHQLLRGRTVLVTGGAGSIGSEICHQLAVLDVQRVLCLDNNETGLFLVEREVLGIPGHAEFVPLLGDITDKGKLDHIFGAFRPDVVFHAAAYKHVPMLEAHPEEAVRVNILATATLCSLAATHGCERFIFISTDKAVNPVNVLGFSKRIGEQLVRASASPDTIFASVRFGNVIGSRGSALPEFMRQIDRGGPVTVTHPEVERYFMTITEAVGLVIQTALMATGGDLFMLDMGQPVKIVDIVESLMRLRGLRAGQDIEVEYIGLRPGEKMSETLVSATEVACPTSHPSIYTVQHQGGPILGLDDTIQKLRCLAAQGESAALIAQLRARANPEAGEFDDSILCPPGGETVSGPVIRGVR